MLLDQHSTDRLRFRCLTTADISPLQVFFADPAATRYLPLVGQSEKPAEEWIKNQLRRYDMSQLGLYALELKNTGKLVGQSGLLWQFVDGIPKWEVCYYLLPEYWGQGLATEAASSCRDFCFENEIAETLISMIHRENQKSLAVAARTGMSYWKSTLFKGHPCEVYRIRRTEWEIITGRNNS